MKYKSVKTCFLLIFLSPSLLVFLSMTGVSFNSYFPLAGVQSSAPSPKLTIAAWLDGSYQRNSEESWRRGQPFAAVAVKTYNQLYAWSNFNLFFNPRLGIVRDHDDLLFSGGLKRRYDRAYQKRRNNAVRPSLEAVVQTQKSMKRNGIPFVFIAVAGKEECMRHDFAWYYRFYIRKAPVSIDYRSVLDGHVPWRRILPTFPITGTHWDSFGAWDGVKNALRLLSTDYGWMIPPIEPSSFTNEKSSGQERDLALLLNQWCQYAAETAYPMTVFSQTVPTLPYRLFIWADSYGFEFYRTLLRCRLLKEENIRLGNLYKPLEAADRHFIDQPSTAVVMIVAESNLEYPEFSERLRKSIASERVIDMGKCPGAKPAYSGTGFSEPAGTGCWTVSHCAALDLPLTDNETGELTLEIDAHPMLTGKIQKQRVGISLSGRFLGEVVFQKPGIEKIRIPAELLNGRKILKLSFDLPDAVAPPGHENEQNGGKLGIYIRQLILKRQL